MTPDDIEHGVSKALEVWGLQSMLDVSILLGILASGMALVQGYWRSLEQHLTLRVSIELWRVFSTLLVDILLVVAVLVGFLVMNPDMMSDVKMAVPFYPIGTVLLAWALVLRLLHGGHAVGSPNWLRALWLMLAANAVQVIGFTFVMEAPGPEYLATHPSAFWSYIETHLRSNADPCGLEVAQWTFYVCFGLLVAAVVWGVVAAVRQIKKLGAE